MNIKKFLRKAFLSLFPFKTTPRTYEVLDELFHLICSESIDYALKHLIVYIYCKRGKWEIAYEYKSWFVHSQNTDYPCYNLKRKLIDNVYEAEVTYEGDLLPYIAVLNRDENSLELMPDFKEGLESLKLYHENDVMRLMPQIQQAKELIALNEAMKTGAQYV